MTAPTSTTTAPATTCQPWCDGFVTLAELDARTA
jgi:hypothetical protein